MDKKAQTVSEITQVIKKTVEGNPILQNIWVRGEISNLSNNFNRSKHMYFSLKEENAVIKAAMFAGDNRSLTFQPKDGMKVLAFGSVQIYAPQGSYQFIIKKMEMDGVGNLYLKLEELKKKLDKEGLFAEERKRPLPRYPRKVGVITSPTGAAVRDIITTIKRRYPIAQIVFEPALVQGEGSALSIQYAIEKMNRYGELDVLIVGRGGGSIEDLWSFNEENLVRAIAASKIPIISAVGHQTDFTLSDFVADHRSPTPTAAAEEAVPNIRELQSAAKEQRKQLEKVFSKLLTSKKETLQFLQKRLELTDPVRKIRDNEQRLDYLQETLNRAIANQLQKKDNKVLTLIAKLDGLNPLKVMGRGYTLARQDNELIKSITEINPKLPLDIQWQDGHAVCTITKILRKDGIKS